MWKQDKGNWKYIATNDKNTKNDIVLVDIPEGQVVIKAKKTNKRAKKEDV